MPNVVKNIEQRPVFIVYFGYDVKFIKIAGRNRPFLPALRVQSCMNESKGFDPNSGFHWRAFCEFIVESGCPNLSLSES